MNEKRRLKYAEDEETRERAKEKAKDYYKARLLDPKWVESERERKKQFDTPDRALTRLRAWRAKNPHRSAAQVRKRQASKVSATPSWLTPEQNLQIEQLYLDARRKEIETGVKHHVDHIVPLTHKLVCGLHVPWNLQVIPATDNVRKHNKFEV